jgi:CHASE3 domain sensor protein
MQFDMNTLSTAFKSLKVLSGRGHLRETGTSALVVAAALLLSAVLLLGVNVSSMRRNFDWVQQVDNELLQLSAVESGVIGDELSVRGYALTNDPMFLTYQKSNRRDAAVSMAKLAALVAGDAEQTARFVKLQRVIAKHSDVFGALTRLGPGQAPAVAAAIVDQKNRVVTDDVRTQLTSFRDDELTLLAKRQTMAAAQASRTYNIAVAIVVAAFLLGGLGVLVSQYGRVR